MPWAGRPFGYLHRNLSVVWEASCSPAAGGVAFGVGVVTDVDHLYNFYRWYVRRNRGKLTLFFHAWEYPVAGLLVLSLVYYHLLLLA